MSKNHPKTHSVSSSQPANNSLHTKWFLVIFFLIGFVWGLRNIWYWEPSKLDLLLRIAICINFYSWCITDARRRGYSIPLLAKPFFLLLAGVMLPGYVIWSRGWRGLGWVVLLFIIWCVMVYVVTYAGGHIMYGDEWSNGVSEL